MKHINFCNAACVLVEIVTLCTCAAVRSASADYFPLWQKQPPNITDLALIYQGGEQRPQWTTNRFAPYVSYTDSATRKEEWLFDGFLFLEFADGKRAAFQPWPGVPAAKKSDWLRLLDRNFAEDDGIPNLEKACAATAARIGQPLRPRQLIITIPEPLSGQTNWGEINGKALDFRKMPDRLAAIDWFLDRALERWRTFAPKQLKLAGFYWGYEGTRANNDFIPSAARLVHGRGYQFFWIPYWDKAGYQRNWKALGFDVAWQQPNHFFHPEVPDSRLTEACDFARERGMGLEMEFDGRMLKGDVFEPRFGTYLDTFTKLGVKKTSSIAYYEGGGALFSLATSDEPGMRRHYDRIARFILERQAAADNLSRATQ